MSTLEKALEILGREFGELDNVKLLLGDVSGMSPESVAVELLELARQTESGALRPVVHFNESALAGAVVDF